MKITRDRSKRTIGINQTDYTCSILDRFNMKDCNRVSIPSTGAEWSLDQPIDTLLDEDGIKLYQSMVVVFSTCQELRGGTSHTQLYNGLGRRANHQRLTSKRWSMFFGTSKDIRNSTSSTGAGASNFRHLQTRVSPTIQTNAGLQVAISFFCLEHPSHGPHRFNRSRL